MNNISSVVIAVSVGLCLASPASEQNPTNPFYANPFGIHKNIAWSPKSMPPGESSTYQEIAKPSERKDCVEITKSVSRRIAIDPTTVLEIVEMEVAASPACAGEIVKSAIRATDAEPELVVSIVETAVHVSPENMSLISQCAIAVAPDSLAAVQRFMAKLDPSSKIEKVSTEAIADILRINMGSSPLDLPRQHVVTPIPIIPPQVTRVDP